MSETKALKQKIIQSAEAVKKKVKLLRNMKTNNDMILESVFKPITEPLNEMVKASQDHNYEGEIENDSAEIKWEMPVKKIEYSAINKNNDSINEQTVGGKSSSEYSISNEDTSDLSEDDVDEEVGSNSAAETSFKTSDSYASPRDDPNFQKQYNYTNLNIPFGVRTEWDKLMLGNYSVYMNDKKLKVNGNTYILTPGLHNLLFKKVPDLNIITERDRRNYKMLLLETNAHRRDFDPSKPIKSNKGLKYLYVIRPLFKLTKDRSTSNETCSQGQGLPIMKKVRNNVSYVYWDNPNELVERLKLLMASRDAGNTGLDNEIISIIEELREADLINNPNI